MIILQTSQLLYYMAILLFVGLACGAITGIVDARTATKEEIGLLMTKTDERKEENA